jgi:transposase
MLPLSNGRIWLSTAHTDMRKQFDGLAALVQSQLSMRAQCGDWFVFINKRRTQIKVLYYHQGGYCLWSKRLEKGTFAKVVGDDSKIALYSAQLQCLIDGIYWDENKQNKRFN